MIGSVLFWSLFEQAGSPYEPATGHAAYPGGGYWVMRAGGLVAIVEAC